VVVWDAVCVFDGSRDGFVAIFAKHELVGG